MQVTLNKALLFCSTLLLVGFVIYFPGLSGPFLLDDYTNFARLAYVDGSYNGFLLAVFGNDGDLLGRPISYLSFVLNASSWPNSAFGFKVINLVLHILVGALVALFVYRLPVKHIKNKNVLTVLVLGFWLLSPIHVSTVLYAVQRMTILSALFSVLAIYSYLRFRQLDKGRNWLLITFICVGCAFLSKQNGLLVILLIALLEIYLSKIIGDLRPIKYLNTCLAFFVISFLALLSFYIWKYLPFFEGRSFSVLERLGIQGSVLWDYLRLTVVPILNDMSLHHDDYELNIANKAKIGGLFWLFHLIVITISIFFWKRLHIISFGILWFYIMHIMEASALPLELMFEHRNYFPSIGLSLVFAYLFSKGFEYFSKYSQFVRVSVCVSALIVLTILLSLRVGDWAETYRMTLKWSAYQNDSARSKYSYAVELERAGFASSGMYEMKSAAEKFSRIGFAFHAWRMQCELGAYNEAKITFPSVQTIQSSNFTSEVIYEFKLLSKYWVKGECIPNGMTNNELDKILAALVSMPLLDFKLAYKANLLKEIGNFYFSLKRADKATEMYLALYNAQPTIDTALMNAEHAIRIGVINYAEEYVTYAEKMNEKSLWLAGDRSLEIDKIRNIIRARSSSTIDGSE